MKPESEPYSPGIKTQYRLYTLFRFCYTYIDVGSTDNLKKEGFCMAEIEMLQKNVEVFERLQDYMISCDKESEAYKK